MAHKYSDLSGEELFVKNNNGFANDSGDYLILGLCGIALFGVGLYFYTLHLNARFDKLESQQKGHQGGLDITKQRIVNIEKKIMTTKLQIDALKTVVDYNRNEYFTWYPSIKS